MSNRDYNITAPDGSQLVITGPEDATNEQIRAAAVQAFGIRQMPAATGPKPEQPESLWNKNAQGLKNFAGGAVRGAGSIGATLLAPIDAAARAIGIQNDFIGRTDRRQAMDDALTRLGADPASLVYQGAKLATEVAGTAGSGSLAAAGLRAIPVAARLAPNLLTAIDSAGAAAGSASGARALALKTLGGGANGAVSAGLINPSDMGSGAAIGAVLPGAMTALGKLSRAATVGNAADAGLASKAIDQYGIPLGVADVSQSKALRATRSVLNDTPLIGGIGLKQREAVQQGLNRAVGDTFGAPERQLTPDVLDAAKKRLGGEFDRIWNGNTLRVDGQLIQRLSELQSTAAKLPKAEGGSLAAEIQDVLSKVQQTGSGDLVIPGESANRFQSYLRRRAEGSQGLRNELTDLRQSIISAFNRSVSAEDAAALATNRSRYKAFKTVEPLLNSAEVGAGGRIPGDVPAALLPNAVRKSYSNPAGSPLTELSQIAGRFIVDRTPQTGGSTRAAIQNAAIGAGLAGGAYSSPLMALLTVPAAAGVQKGMGSPDVLRKLLGTPQGQNALERLIEAGPYSTGIQRVAPSFITGDERR